MNISNYLRNYAIMRTYGRCAYCGCKIIDEKTHGATFDHVVPLVKGGSTSKDNLLLCCFDCNQAKGKLTLEEFRQKRLNDLQTMIKKSGLLIKATGDIKFFFERLRESPSIGVEIEQFLDEV